MTQATFMGLPIKSWTGGSYAAGIQEVPADEFLLILELYREQVATWEKYWGDKPDNAMKKLFWNRARQDAHATFNQQ
jgi:hypothetical protein